MPGHNLYRKKNRGSTGTETCLVLGFTDPESGAEEAGIQTDLGRRRCRGKKFMRRQMEMQDGDCHFRYHHHHHHHHHHEKKMMKKMAKKMMWRRMMFRMCYGGGPFGMGPGFGYRRRMRMAMLDTTDTSSSESEDRQHHGAGWRHHCRCRGGRFGRRFEDGGYPEDQTTGKDQSAEAQTQNEGEADQNTAPASTSKDSVTTQTTSAENIANQTKESAASGRIHEKKGRRKEHKKWKCMRRVHFCDTSSDDSSSDSSSSSSESSCDENEAPQEISKSKEHGGRRWRRGWRRHHEQEQTKAKGKEGDKGRRGKKAWKGKKFHKKMMKGMGKKGRFMRFF